MNGYIGAQGPEQAGSVHGAEQGYRAEHSGNGRAGHRCPHCLATVPNLSAHLRDDGGAGTRCPELQRKDHDLECECEWCVAYWQDIDAGTMSGRAPDGTALIGRVIDLTKE